MKGTVTLVVKVPIESDDLAIESVLDDIGQKCGKAVSEAYGGYVDDILLDDEENFGSFVILEYISPGDIMGLMMEDPENPEPKVFSSYQQAEAYAKEECGFKYSIVELP